MSNSESEDSINRNIVEDPFGNIMFEANPDAIQDETEIDNARRHVDNARGMRKYLNENEDRKR